MLVNHRFPKVRKLFCKTVNVDQKTDERMELWILYFEAFWLFNVIGEAIPQLIIRFLFSSLFLYVFFLPFKKVRIFVRD